MKKAGFAMVLILMLASACSGSGNTPSGAGTITFSANDIPGQQGNTMYVAAFDYDWQPGDPSTNAIGGFVCGIATDPYSMDNVLRQVDSQGQPTLDNMLFTAGTYNVVFLIYTPGSSPSIYAEVQVTVNGDTTVTSPLWSEWVHL